MTTSGIRRDDIRNIAIIAHVDHGKTTLVDKMLQQAGTFRANQVVAERVMDSNDLERERGITILAKNTSIRYGDYKINIMDTPGHADFGGQVERVLTMVEGVLLLVDAAEGPLPQTKFVLRKSLELNLKPIVVINKIDRPDARAHEVLDMILDLFIELGANDEQLDFPVIYASAKNGYAQVDLETKNDNLEPLFKAILEKVPCPVVEEGSLQMQVNSIDYSDFLGRLAVGRIRRGSINYNETVSLCKLDGTIQKGKVTKIFSFEGLTQKEVTSASAGEIIAVAGFDGCDLGETLADRENPEALPASAVDEPTIAIQFMVNDSPFAGKEGKFVTSRQIRDRLYKEAMMDPALRVEDTEKADTLKVSGRGELHLTILIEKMRRENFEFAVSRPEVILKRIDGELKEPIETLYIDTPDDAMGAVIERIGRRKADMKNMEPTGNGSTRITFSIPARGLIGFRTEFLTVTRGMGLMNHEFEGYGPYKGDIPSRTRGVLLSMDQCDTVAYAIFNLQDRGEMFLGAGVPVYEGMIIGEHSREGDLVVNIGKGKKLTNMRASGSDENVALTPPRRLSLEQMVEFLEWDELLEVTPKNLRLRKKHLSANDRKRVTRTSEQPV
jgi:GTP-binding protein